MARIPGRADVASARAACWALVAVRQARRQLRRGPVDRVRLAEPPRPAPGARRGVDAVLARLGPSCLERSLVLQRWLASAGDPRDVIIGVATPADGFRAHAWLEGESGPGFTEIRRVAP